MPEVAVGDVKILQVLSSLHNVYDCALDPIRF